MRRRRLLPVVAVALTLAAALAPFAGLAATQAAGHASSSRPLCRDILPLSVIASVTGKTLEFEEWGNDRFLLGGGKEIARGHSCVYKDPAREGWGDPYAGFFKAAFEATPQEWNALRTVEKGDQDFKPFKPMKAIAGTKLFSLGPAVPMVPPNLSETGETPLIFGYTKQHNVFEVGITNVPIATEKGLVNTIAERLDGEWLKRGRS